MLKVEAKISQAYYVGKTDILRQIGWRTHTHKNTVDEGRKEGNTLPKLNKKPSVIQKKRECTITAHLIILMFTELERKMWNSMPEVKGVV